MKHNDSSLYTSSALYSRSSLVFAGLALTSLAFSTDALALPHGASVTAGQATISTPSTTQEVITQTTDKTVINWQSFNIQNGESTKFVQPNSNSIALNRVTGAGSSQILGSLSANGHVWLINPNGTFFGPNAQVNVGGLIASTADISDKNFLNPKNGHYTFDKASKNGSASIVNEGTITARQGGLVALVAPGVRNDGIISAKAGTVALGGAQTATVDFYGDNLYSFTLGKASTQQAKDQNGNVMSAAVTNTGAISAQGGTIYLTANAAKEVVNQAINTTGIVDASSAHAEGGAIVLDGGDSAVRVAGQLNASGQTGGTVQVSGGDITLTKHAAIDASGTKGGGQVTVGGGLHGQGALPHAQKVTAKAGSVIDVSATDTGNGGTAVLWSDEQTTFDGSILAHGGINGGNGGLVETSGKTLAATGNVDASAAKGNAGNWLLDPNNITIQASGADSNVAGNPTFTSTNDNAVVTTGSIDAALNNGTNVSITTSSGGANTQSGVITVADNISKTAGSDATLSLQAASDIIINGGVQINATTGRLNVVLDSNTAGNGGAIVMQSGSGIATNGGNITLGGGANPLTGAAVGDATSPAGINLFNASLNAAGGNIVLNGAGTGSTDVNAIGVFASNGTTVSTTGTGTVTMNGTGGGTGASHNDHGIEISNSNVSTVDGDITLNGTGGNGTGGTNSGVTVQDNAMVGTRGIGSIIINGKGGTGTAQDNWGIGVLNSFISTEAGTGNITLNGIGGTGDGGFNDGIYIAGTGSFTNNITLNGVTSSTGNVTLNGIGGSGAGGYNDGVFVQADGNTVQSFGGNVSITGNSGTGGNHDDGVYLSPHSRVLNEGAGAIAINGTGVNNGIVLDGANINVIGSGNIALTGNGNDAGIISGVDQFVPVYASYENARIGSASDNGNITLNSNGLISISDVIQTTGNITFNAVTTGISNLVTAGGDITINAVETIFPGSNNITAGGTLAVNNSGIFRSAKAGILNGNTVTLNQNGGTPDSSIQNAIDAVGTYGSGGATLHIGTGVWQETVSLDGKSNFNVIGNGAGNTVIQPTSVSAVTPVQDGPPYGSQYYQPMFLVQNGSNDNVSNLTIDGTLIPTVPTGFVTPAGLLYNNAGGSVNNVTVIQNGAPSLVAIDTSAYGQTAHTVNVSGFTGTSTDRSVAHAIGDELTFNMTGSTLNSGNDIPAMDYSAGSTGSFTGNTINTASGNGSVGIGLHGASGVLISNNVINGGGAGTYGIYSYDRNSNVIVTNNAINNVGSGIVSLGSTGWTIANNTVTAASGSTGNGIEIHLGSANGVDSNTVSGFLNGVYLDGSTSNVTNNTLTGNTTGVDLVNHSYFATVSGNQISGGVTGINVDTAYGISLLNNTISGSGDGIDVTNTQNLSVLGNTLNGSGAGTGLSLDTVSGTVNVGDNVSGDSNSIGNYAINVHINNSDNLTFASNTVTGNGNNIGVLVSNSNNTSFLNDAIIGNLTGIELSNAQNTGINGVAFSNNNTAFEAMNGSGNTLMANTSISGGNVGVLLDGPGSSMQFSGNGSNFSNLNFYFILQNGAMLGQTLDASQQTFDGVIARNFTVAQFDAAEDKTIDLHEDQTISLNNTPGNGTVFYTTFPAPVTPVTPVTPVVTPTVTPTVTPAVAAATAPTGFTTAFNQFLLLNDRLPFGGSLFSYAGHTIASTITEVPYNFRVQEVSLSLLAPNANGTTTINLAQADTGQLSNLAPAAGGDASQLAALSPSAGGLPACGNNFLGTGYELNFNAAACAPVAVNR